MASDFSFDDDDQGFETCVNDDGSDFSVSTYWTSETELMALESKKKLSSLSNSTRDQKVKISQKNITQNKTRKVCEKCQHFTKHCRCSPSRSSLSPTRHYSREKSKRPPQPLNHSRIRMNDSLTENRSDAQDRTWMNEKEHRDHELGKKSLRPRSPHPKNDESIMLNKSVASSLKKKAKVKVSKGLSLAGTQDEDECRASSSPLRSHHHHVFVQKSSPPAKKNREAGKLGRTISVTASEAQRMHLTSKRSVSPSRKIMMEQRKSKPPKHRSRISHGDITSSSSKATDDIAVSMSCATMKYKNTKSSKLGSKSDTKESALPITLLSNSGIISSPSDMSSVVTCHKTIESIEDYNHDFTNAIQQSNSGVNSSRSNRPESRNSQQKSILKNNLRFPSSPSDMSTILSKDEMDDEDDIGNALPQGNTKESKLTNSKQKPILKQAPRISMSKFNIFRGKKSKEGNHRELESKTETNAGLRVKEPDLSMVRSVHMMKMKSPDNDKNEASIQERDSFAEIDLDDSIEADLEKGKAHELSKRNFSSEGSTGSLFVDQKKQIEGRKGKKMICFGIVALIISLLVAFWYTNNKSFQWRGIKTPSNGKSIFYESTLSTLSTLDELRNKTKPQHQAMQWIMAKDPFNMEPSDPLIHTRYVMTLIIISAYSPDNSDQLLTFFGTKDVCEWTGVGCSADGYIDKIILDDHDLVGSVPYELSYLSNLTTLDLSRNNLHGTIPNTYETLHNLEILNLGYNSFHGPIPDNIFDMTSLNTLLLMNNRISGYIPDLTDNASKMYEINLSNNLLTGTLPTSLLLFPSLVKLDISINRLSGTIPKRIHILRNLKEFKLSSNNFVGTIPTELYDMNIYHLHISHNDFVGSISQNIGEMKNLRTLHFDHNKFTGQMPTIIGSLTDLNQIHVHRNDITGIIPIDVCNLVYTETLLELWVDCGVGRDEQGNDYQELQCDCCTRCFVDPVIDREPRILAKLKQVSEVTLLEDTKSNQFKAAQWIMKYDPRELHPNNDDLIQRYILTLFGYATFSSEEMMQNKKWISREHECNWFGVICDNDDRVVGLDLRKQNLSGTIPFELSSIASLSGIALASNEMYGKIPPKLFSLENLLFVDFSDNFLFGTVPDNLFTSQSLRFLYLSNNNLSGQLPSPNGANDILKELWLHGNKLTGSIPDNIGYLTALGDLDFNSNQFTGSIPSSLFEAKDLSYIDFSNNSFTGPVPDQLYTIPALSFLYLASNELTGTISREVGKFTGAKELNYNNNMLTGTIPSDIGKLGSIEFLHLSGNMLSGKIPTTITSFDNITFLDLSDNLISGNIPDQIYSLVTLEFLLLSSNGISGTISSRIGELTNMNELYIDQTYITGTIPVQIGATQLRSLSMYANKLFGTIPSEISELVSLSWLDLSNNGLRGSLPDSLFELKELRYLYLGENMIEGTISPKLDNLLELRDLWLHDNVLSGEVPGEIENLRNLNEIYLQGNNLVGTISKALCTREDTERVTIWSDCISEVECICCSKCF